MQVLNTKKYISNLDLRPLADDFVAMKSSLYLLLSAILISCFPTFASDHSDWLTDIEKAKSLAKEQNKNIFIKFTGSTWCKPCISMNEQVYSKKEFLDYAKEEFILVVIDVPKPDQKDNPELKKYQKLMKTWKVKGLPYAVLVDAEGVEFSRFFAGKYPSIKDMNGHLTKQIRRKDMF